MNNPSQKCECHYDDKGLCDHCIFPKVRQVLKDGEWQPSALNANDIVSFMTIIAIGVVTFYLFNLIKP